MSRRKGHTRLEDERRPQGYPDGVDACDARRANMALWKWLNGEVDKMEAVTTPSGERVVQTYNRDE